MFDGDSDDPSIGKHMDALPTLSHREVASGSGTSEWAVSRLGKEAPTVEPVWSDLDDGGVRSV